MKPPEAELRTAEFPYAYYPDHWGLFPVHDIFPIDEQLHPLVVEHYYICLSTPRNPHPILLGFDDFAPVRPFDSQMSGSAIARRDKLRDSAEARALVRVRKLKHLTSHGIKRLQDVGADVSDAACKKGHLVVGVTGKYNNDPLYYPQNSSFSVLFVQYIHQFHSTDTANEPKIVKRNLRISSADMRTVTRCMLYFERVKLRSFMETTREKNRKIVSVGDRAIEWFVQKYMDKYPLAATAPRKPQDYRGARKHTSEIRHCFVCHAEWLHQASGISSGLDPVIHPQVLAKWAAEAPAKREAAARDDRHGWGVWDSPWKRDWSAYYQREDARLKYSITEPKEEKENYDSGEEGGDGDEDGDVKMLPPRSSERRPTKFVPDQDGRINCAMGSHQDADDAASLDDNQGASFTSKRRKFNFGTTQQPGWASHYAGATTPALPSVTRVAHQRSSPSLGTGFRSSPSLSDPQAGPSRRPWTGSSSDQEALGREKEIKFIVLSSDHDSLVRTRSPSIHVLSGSDDKMSDPSDEGEGCSTNPPLAKRNSAVPRRFHHFVRSNPRSSRSDDEGAVRTSDEESIVRSSDSDTKYKRQDTPIEYTPEQVQQRRLRELTEWMLRLTPDVFFAIAPLNNWSPWHCTLPPISLPFRTSLSAASKPGRCRYMVNLRKPSDDMIRLLESLTEPGDAELLMRLLAKPSHLGLPWDDLSNQILKRTVQLHWEDHYAAWGVKKALREVHHARWSWT
ncbi:hypothetical protein FRC09_004982 [Ceratobasidium sp. 395]|nr:hypothetical protein FRC09_004982 [Ceratobasidium sp. 395]